MYSINIYLTIKKPVPFVNHSIHKSVFAYNIYFIQFRPIIMRSVWSEYFKDFVFPFFDPIVPFTHLRHIVPNSVASRNVH